MSVHPAIGTGSVSTQQGLAQVISDLRRRLSQVEATRTVIQAGSISGGQIQTGSITANEILVGTITTELIAAGAIVAGSIAAGAITSEKIAASAVLTEHLAAGSVTADEIAAGAITAGAIAAGAVTTTTLSAGAVTSDKIAAGAITSDKITVTSLSSLTSNLGSITAGTITGGTIQTAAAGARVVMDSGGLRGYALDGVTKVFEINAGSGIASFTGVANLSSSSVIPGSTVQTGTLPGTAIVTGSISALQIGAGSIQANHIGAGSITADKISVEWGGSNMLWNSSFEDPTVAINMWESANADLQPSQVVIPVEGTQVLRISRPTGSGTVDVGVTSASGAVTGYPGTHPGYYPLVQGRPYTLSGWFTSAAVSRQARVEVNWFDSLYRQSLPAPATTVVRTGSGTLAAAQYEYGVAAINANGQTVLSSALLTVVANSTIQVTATLPADAVGTPFPITAYRVYRRNITTSGAWAYVQFASTAGTAITFNDTGSVTFTAGNPLGTTTATTVASATSLGALITTTVGAGSPSLPLTTDVIRVTHPLLVTDAGGTPATGSTVWTRAKLTATMPNGAAYARPVFRIQGVAVGEVHYLDAAMFEPGDVTTGFSRRSGEVMPGSVGSTQITPNSITTNQIMVGGIHADRIQAATITALQIATSAITADKIAAGEITATKIAAGAITASHIQSDAIDGKTITGATFQTATPPTARMVMDASGLRYVEADGTVALNLSTVSGSAGLNLRAASSTASPESARTITFKSTAGAVAGSLFGTDYPSLGGQLNVQADVQLRLVTRALMVGGFPHNAALTLSNSTFSQAVLTSGANDLVLTNTDTRFNGSNRSIYFSNKSDPVWVDNSGNPTLRANFINMVAPFGRILFDTSANPPAVWLADSWGITAASTSSVHCLTANSFIAGTTGGGSAVNSGNIWATNFIGAWSDERAKENIQPLTSAAEADALTRLRRVRGRKYDKLSAVPRFAASEEAVPVDIPVRRREIGFLAQELEAEFPDLVQTWAPTPARPMEMKWVDAGIGISAVLWEAVNELAAEVDALKAQIGLPPGVALRTRA